MRYRLLGKLAAVILLGLGASACTLVKPIVGAVTGPVIILGHSDGGMGGCCHDGRAAVCMVAGLSLVGAVAGLVTGVVSDVQAIRGVPGDPTQNWWDPFVTNTGDGIK